MTRAELVAAVAAGRWVALLGRSGELTGSIEPGFGEALAAAEAAAVGGGPWRRVADEPEPIEDDR